MIQLFEMIEKLLRGEYDLTGEGLLYAEADLEIAACEASAELYSMDAHMAKLLTEGIVDIGEDYDNGTPEEGEEYTRRVKEVYERAKAMMSRGAAGE